MTTRPFAVDVRRRARWLPEDHDDLESWLDGHRERVEARGEQVVLHPVLTELQELIDADPVVRMYIRWHSPVAGTIVRAFVVEGTYYSEADSEGADAVEPMNSQSYLVPHQPTSAPATSVCPGVTRSEPCPHPARRDGGRSRAVLPGPVFLCDRIAPVVPVVPVVRRAGKSRGGSGFRGVSGALPCTQSTAKPGSTTQIAARTPGTGRR